MKDNKKVIITSVVVLVLGIAMLFGYKAYQKSQIEVGAKAITVVVVDDRNSVKKEFKHNTDAEMLGTALDEMNLIKADDSEFGRYVHTVADINANKDKTEWWKFTINGQDSVTGIDGTPIKDGDAIEFVFTTGW